MKVDYMKSVTKRKLTNEEKLNRKGIASFKQMCSPENIRDIKLTIKAYG